MYEHVRIDIARDMRLTPVAVIISNGKNDDCIQHHQYGRHTHHHSTKASPKDYHTATESTESSQSFSSGDQSLRGNGQGLVGQRTTSFTMQIGNLLCNTER